MPLNILVGAQWGDEGKGRIVDLLAGQADIVARYNGGDNTGHTVTVGRKIFRLHLIPAGIIHGHTIGVLGNGMVINPEVLLHEMERLRSSGVTITPERLRISYAAHLISPAHLALDRAQERALGKAQIGTTGRGVGPAYADKAARRGLRMLDMLDAGAFAEKMAAHIRAANHLLQALYGAAPLDPEAIATEYSEYARQLAPYIADVSALLRGALASGKRVLAEGAQGTLLDLDHGTYPYVTSSTPTSAGALSGLGLSVTPVERSIGVTNSFQTRLGAGPFPTEVSGEIAARLRGVGDNPWDEMSPGKSQPRRVGWLDSVLLRYAVAVNGLSELVITKLDALSGIQALRICTAYRAGESVYGDLPMGPADLSPYQPVYEELPGWQADISRACCWEDLPLQARAFILRIEELSGIPVSLVSVGPERDQIIEIGGD
jgi:adenylosuccinate synthase